MADAQKKVDDLIRDHAVMIFSKVGCPHCDATKELFKAKGVQTYVLDLNTKDDGYELQQALTTTQFNGGDTARTVPRIYVLKELLGGNDAIQLLENKGKLDEKLQDEHITKGKLVSL